jgi:hypothetical protein
MEWLFYRREFVATYAYLICMSVVMGKNKASLQRGRAAGVRGHNKQKCGHLHEQKLEN